LSKITQLIHEHKYRTSASHSEIKSTTSQYNRRVTILTTIQ